MSQENMEFNLFNFAEINEKYETGLTDIDNPKMDKSKMVVRKLNRTHSFHKKTVSPSYTSSKEKVLKELPIGTLIYFDSMIIPERMEIAKVEDGFVTGEMVDIKLDGTLVEMKRGHNRIQSVSVDEVLAFETNIGPHFFTKDTTKAAEVKNNVQFVQYFNGMTKELREQFLVYATYIVDNALTMYDIERKNVDKSLSIGTYTKNVKAQENNEIGYWESFFANKPIGFEGKWAIHYFGQECSIERVQMKQLFEAYMQTIRSDKPLNEMTDFELMGYYLLAGYNVKLDFITFEWTVSKIDSTKEIFVTREQLEDLVAIEDLWGELFEKEQPYELESLIDDESGFRSVYSNVESKMKPFVIPNKSIVILPDDYYAVTEHHLYEVQADDGLYVDLKPIERGKERAPAIGIKNLRMPRKHVHKVFIGQGKDKKTFQIPYGISENMESTFEQLEQNYVHFINEMSLKEMQQYILLDAYSNSAKLIQALRENDEELVIKFSTSEGCSWKNTEHLNGLNFIKEDNKYFAYTSYDRRYKFKVTEKSRIYPGKIIASISQKDALKQFKQMFNKVYASFTNPTIQLTVPEMILAYSLKGMSLSYSGTPTHFIVNGKTVHTTKHDLNAVQTMKAFIQ